MEVKGFKMKKKEAKFKKKKKMKKVKYKPCNNFCPNEHKSQQTDVVST